MKIITIYNGHLAAAILALNKNTKIYRSKKGIGPRGQSITEVSYPDSDEELIKKIDSEWRDKKLTVNLFEWVQAYRHVKKELKHTNIFGRVDTRDNEHTPDISLNA